MTKYQRHRHEYGVFFRLHGPEPQGGYHSLARWARLTNKRDALRMAKRVRGEVRTMLASGSAWDAPTYRVCSDLIVDFRRTGASSTKHC